MCVLLLSLFLSCIGALPIDRLSRSSSSSSDGSSLAEVQGAATDAIKAKQTALIDLMKQSATAQQLAAIFDQFLDYDDLAAGSLGSEWSPRSAAEKAQFIDLLKQLLRSGYTKNLKSAVGSSIVYRAEEPGNGGLLIKTAIQQTDMDLLVKQISGAWKVYDITTDGVSIVSAYREQFTKIVKKDGFPTLISKMKEKLAQI